MTSAWLRSPALGALLAAFLCGATLGACDDFGRSACARVVCDSGRVCDPATGACIEGDDVVRDAGVDAGAPFDAGCSLTCAETDAGVCDPASGLCVECLTSLDCRCPTPVCNASHACEPLANDAGVTPVLGESCGSVSVVNSCNQSMSFSVDLSSLKDNEQTSACGGAGGKDAVSSFVVSATSDVRITARRASTSPLAQPVLAVRKNGCSGAELACADSRAGVSSIRLRSLAAGTYGLLVDAFDSASNGVIDVTVEFLPATLPVNETCSLATPMPTTGDDQDLDLTVATDDVEVSCNPLVGSPDAIYSFSVDAGTDIFVIAQSPAGSRADGVVALYKGPCGKGEELGCANAVTGLVERLSVRNVAAGTYYLVVESAGRPDAGGFLKVNVVTEPPQPPPANDTCAAPRALVFQGTSTVTDVFDPSAARDDESGSCNTAANSPDMVFSLTLGAAHSVTVTATPRSAGVRPVVYLRSGACTGAADADGGASSVTEEACAADDGSGAAVLQASLQPGTYFLFLEGKGAASGPTNLSVTLGP